MRRLGLTLLLGLVTGCSTTYPIQAGDLDGGTHPASSKLVSQEFPNPSEAEKDQLVVVAAHGYTATTFELQPAAIYLRSQGMRVSEVLLGAHGTSVQDFEKSTWKTWQAPIVDEYHALQSKGYRNIALLGTSTGCTLILEALSSGKISPAPKRVALVAPLIEIKNKMAGYAGLLDWFGMKYLDTNPKGDSVGNWYRFRPASTITSLVDLTEVMKARLRTGITLDGTKTLVVQSDQDPTVDPVSAELLKQGLKS
ncbi:MAG TPA: hypothetical protein V6D05_03720, partial [Stenomitos sp.]